MTKNELINNWFVFPNGYTNHKISVARKDWRFHIFNILADGTFQHKQSYREELLEVLDYDINELVE